MAKTSAESPNIPAHWTDVRPQRKPAASGNPPWTVTQGGRPQAVLPRFDNLNDSSTAPPSDAELGFSPRALGPWIAIIRHPFDAYTAAHELKDQAKQETWRQFPQDRDFHNDAADAFRHTYWNYLMTRAFGADEARQFGNAHEIWEPNPSGERYMDLYNNEMGRNLAQTSRGDPVNTVKNAVNQGTTRNSPFNRR